MHEKGRHVEEDREAALHLYDKACTGGEAVSCMLAGYLSKEMSRRDRASRWKRTKTWLGLRRASICTVFVSSLPSSLRQVRTCSAGSSRRRKRVGFSSMGCPSSVHSQGTSLCTTSVPQGSGRGGGETGHGLLQRRAAEIVPSIGKIRAERSIGRTRLRVACEDGRGRRLGCARARDGGGQSGVDRRRRDGVRRDGICGSDWCGAAVATAPHEPQGRRDEARPSHEDDVSWIRHRSARHASPRRWPRRD